MNRSTPIPTGPVAHPVAPLHRAASRLHQGSLWLVAGVALAILLFGWLPWRLGGAPLWETLAETKANTAVGLIVLVAATILARPRVLGRWPRILVFVLAGFVVALGLATPAQDAFGVDLHIDTVLFPDPDGHLTPGAPGRMSPLSALTLVFAGGALLFQAARPGGWRTSVREGLAVLTLSTPLFVLASHLYGSPIFPALTEMAPTTLVALLALGLVMTTARPDDGRMARFWDNTPGGFVARRLIPVTIVTVLALGWLGTFAEARGLDPAVATAFFAMTLIVAAVVLIGVAARSLDRSEAERRHAEAQAAEVQARLVEAAADQRLNLAKLQFVNRAAHELNTPLTPVRVQMELLTSGRLGPLSKAQIRAVDQLSRNVQRLMHIVRQILDAVDPRDRKANLTPTSIAVDGLLRDALLQHRHVAANATVRLYAGDQCSGRVAGDPDRLMLAVSNLIVNAIDATPAGGEVCVSTHTEGDQVHIEVRDTGRGLTEEEIGRLFRPFTELAEAGTPIPSDAGLGMGLYIVRRIVDAHGGTVKVESEGRGRGARFQIALPMADPDGARAEPIAASGRTERASG